MPWPGGVTEGGVPTEKEGELPGVLRTQKTQDAEGQEIVCFPSFVIAGTQKSGTTALTGELVTFDL